MLTTGCFQQVADFTLASTNNFDLNIGQFIKGELVEWEYTKAIILVPLGIPSIK
jgi:hypothetical protein